MRFIPTHVGNTFRCSSASATRPVHPHACGEHDELRAKFPHENGSSPRMWGTHRFNYVTLQWSAVHPHACGEHKPRFVNDIHCCGSSPRMWGTPTVRLGSCETCRFIPTHVGNTTLPLMSTSLLSVHPHECGEHNLLWNLYSGFCGSSPRMWGTRSLLLNRYISLRFIPTHVGNTRHGTQILY